MFSEFQSWFLFHFASPESFAVSTNYLLVAVNTTQPQMHATFVSQPKCLPTLILCHNTLWINCILYTHRCIYNLTQATRTSTNLNSSHNWQSYSTDSVPRRRMTCFQDFAGIGMGDGQEIYIGIGMNPNTKYIITFGQLVEGSTNIPWTLVLIVKFMIAYSSRQTAYKSTATEVGGWILHPWEHQ